MSTPAHVVIVTPELWGLTSENGGISTSVFHFARLFRSRGDRVTVLVGLANEAHVEESWQRRYEADEIDVRTTVARKAPRSGDRAPYAIDFPFAAVSEAVARALPADADIVYFQDWCALGFETLRRQKLGTATSSPLAVTVLRGSSGWARPGWELLPDEDDSRTALAHAERFAVEQSDIVVSPSHAYREDALAQGVHLPPADRTRVVHHPWLPVEGGQSGPRPRSSSFRRLVYFGRLETRKGLDLFLDALAELDARSDLVRRLDEIVFVGREGDHRRQSLEAVAEEGRAYGAECAFRTDLDTWTATDFLSEVVPDGLVVLPSLRENFPNAVIEASLVPGLNVICSDVGGVTEILGEGGSGQLFEPDAGALADTLGEWLVRGPVPASELVSYDWETANERWLAFHAELLGAGRARNVNRRRTGRLYRRRSARSAEAASLSLVICTYERPDALDAVLRALSEQSDPDFDLVVADDGSGPDTEAVVDRWRTRFGSRLEYVWQPDEGFRVARALNRGALASRAEYLVFMNGESIPRKHLVRALRSAAHPGWFVAGRRIELAPILTERVLERRLPIHRWSLGHWLLAHRDARSLIAFTPRDRRRVGADRLPEFEPENRGYGYLTGIWRNDFERVNGYDMRFVGWGEEDVDLAVRLRRLGLRCGHAGPHATLIHLWHSRREVRDRPNWWLLQETERSDRIEAVVGLRELASELAEAHVSAKRVGSSSSSSEPV